MPQIITAVALIALLLSACGGGGGGDNPPIGSSATFSGTVAIGAPLAGASITLIHADGAAAFATTDAAGRYSVTLTGLPSGARPLFMLQTHDPASGVLSQPVAYPRLFSIANRSSGTVNITPLTSLQVAQLLTERQGFFTDLTLMRTIPIPSDGDIAAARQAVVNYLLQRSPPVDASGVADFIRTPFNAVTGDPHDNAIENLAQTFMEGETIAGVEEHMLARNDPVPNLLEILSLELDATCVIQGIPNPPLPAGVLHISLRPTGEIIIGSYTHTLLPNVDRVRKSNSPFFDDFWQFQLVGSGTGDQLEIAHSGKRLSSVALIRPGGSTRCAPIGSVPLGTRVPSVLGQVRRLGSTIAAGNPLINCPGGSAFPGLNDGANVLAIQSNGALRSGGVPGYALHLPSLGLDMSAEIVSNAGVLGIGVLTAGFSRVFAGGFDSFGITLDGSGDVQTVNFGQRRNGGPSLSQNCT